MKRFLALAALLVAAPAAADSDPCSEARDLRAQVIGLQEDIAVLIEDAKPVCAEKALKKECARRRVEIAGFMRSLDELDAQRKVADAACREAGGTP